MKAKSPAFSLYPKDILTDEDCVAMEHEHFGMYVRLLCHAWLEGSIPNDKKKLARMLNVGHRKLERAWAYIERCWDAAPDDATRLIQRRLEVEREKQRQRSIHQGERGSKGGRPSKSTIGETQRKPHGNPDDSRTKPEKSLAFPSPFPLTESINLESKTLFPPQGPSDAVAVAAANSNGHDSERQPIPSDPVRLTALYFANFNACFGRRLGYTAKHVDRVRARLKDGFRPWHIAALPILVDAQGLSSDMRREAKPSWFLRDGKHSRTMSSGQTAGATDWLERALEKLDRTTLSPKHVTVARQSGVLASLEAAGATIAGRDVS